MKFLPKRHESESIDMTPMIDMVFILLIFFAVSTSFVKDMRVNLERPSAATGSVASTKSVRVYIDREGVIYLNEQAVKTWMLQSLVREALAVSSSQAVLVIADAKTPTDTLIEVVDQCRLAGATDVGVATEQP